MSIRAIVVAVGWQAGQGKHNSRREHGAKGQMEEERLHEFRLALHTGWLRVALGPWKQLNELLTCTESAVTLVSLPFTTNWDSAPAFAAQRGATVPTSTHWTPVTSNHDGRDEGCDPLGLLLAHAVGPDATLAVGPDAFLSRRLRRLQPELQVDGIDGLHERVRQNQCPRALARQLAEAPPLCQHQIVVSEALVERAAQSPRGSVAGGQGRPSGAYRHREQLPKARPEPCCAAPHLCCGPISGDGRAQQPPEAATPSEQGGGRASRSQPPAAAPDSGPGWGRSASTRRRVEQLLCVADHFPLPAALIPVELEAVSGLHYLSALCELSGLHLSPQRLELLLEARKS